jgi:hypothetical protein
MKKHNLSSDTQLSITVSKLENPQAISFKSDQENQWNGKKKINMKE